MTEKFDSHRNLNEYRKGVVPKKVPCVQVSHIRVEGSPKGGMTMVRLWLDKGTLVSGHAFCCVKDTYNKKKGKSIAFGRLMRSIYMSGSKPEYLSRIKKLIQSQIGGVDMFFFNQAFNGDYIR